MVFVAPAGSFHHQRPADDESMFQLSGAAQRGAAAHADAVKAAGGGGGIQFWQMQSSQPTEHPTAAEGSPGGKKTLAAAMLDDGGRGRVVGDDPGSGAAATCHDCGNQAKKGCAHSRCRTCCNSRGFDCDTHLKSTWVPAARRREIQQLASSTSPTSANKKPRLLASPTSRPAAVGTNSRASTSNATTPRSVDTSSSHQDASFRESLPRQVRGPAVFRCVQVTSVDDGQREVAYQAAVTINGHLFRGLLYDLGAAAERDTSDLHLGSAGSGPAGNLYAGGGGGQLILGGLGYGGSTP